MSVGLVASDGPNEDVAEDGAPTARLYHAYETVVLQLAQARASVVVLPEKTGVVVDPLTREVDAQLQALAGIIDFLDLDCLSPVHGSSWTSQDSMDTRS